MHAVYLYTCLVPDFMYVYCSVAVLCTVVQYCLCLYWHLGKILLLSMAEWADVVPI